MNKFDKFLYLGFLNKYYKQPDVKEVNIKVTKQITYWGNRNYYGQIYFYLKSKEIYLRPITSRKRFVNLQLLSVDFNRKPTIETLDKICDISRIDSGQILKIRRSLDNLSDEGKLIIKDKLNKLEEIYPSIETSVSRLQEDLIEIKNKVNDIRRIIHEGEEFIKLGEIPPMIKIGVHHLHNQEVFYYIQKLNNYINLLKEKV